MVAPRQFVITYRRIEARRHPSHIPEARHVVSGDAGRLCVLFAPLRRPVPDPIPDPPLAAATDRAEAPAGRQPFRPSELFLRNPRDRRHSATGAAQSRSPARPRTGRGRASLHSVGWPGVRHSSTMEFEIRLPLPSSRATPLCITPKEEIHVYHPWLRARYANMARLGGSAWPWCRAEHAAPLSPHRGQPSGCSPVRSSSSRLRATTSSAWRSRSRHPSFSSTLRRRRCTVCRSTARAAAAVAAFSPAEK